MALRIGNTRSFALGLRGVRGEKAPEEKSAGLVAASIGVPGSSCIGDTVGCAAGPWCGCPAMESKTRGSSRGGGEYARRSAGG